MKSKAMMIFAIFAILFFSSVSGVFCEETNSIYIKIYEDGSALWNLETRFELKTQADINFFNEYMAALEEDKEFIIQQKKDSLQNIVNTVAYSSGREMSIENISLNYQIIDYINKKYGEVNIKFLWTGFSLKEMDMLKIGDAFSEGSYIKNGEVLVIEYPESYSINSVYPEPNEKRENSLLWYGPKILLENEPRVILEKKSLINSMNILLFGIICILVIFIALIYFFVISKKNKNAPIMLSDHEKVTNILRSSGGKCFQNDIVSQSGMSKSKISQIISEMEKNELIAKQKYGKNNLIILK
jgi:predicted transcriptional regulator